MRPLYKVTKAAQDVLCQNIYQKCILSTSEFLAKCEEIAEVLGLHLPSTCYTNFRDALFHFRRLVHSMEDTEISNQAFAISEHVSRAKTDAIVVLLESISDILQMVLGKYSFDKERRVKIVNLQNQVTEYVLNYRLGGAMLDNVSILRPEVDIFFTLIKNFFDMIRDEIGAEKYQECITERDSFE